LPKLISTGKENVKEKEILAALDKENPKKVSCRRN